MDLSNLKPAEGATRNRKRVGRGEGSGRGGTSTRGHKGQGSRSGASIPAWFEGGQMPLTRRVPKFGFTKPNRKPVSAVNLHRLATLVDDGRIDASEPITPDTLIAVGLARKDDRVKILGSGELTTALSISAHKFSASARRKIEAAGGSVTELD